MVADALVDDVTEVGRQYVFRPAPKASIQGRSAVEFVLQAAEKAE